MTARTGIAVAAAAVLALPLFLILLVLSSAGGGTATAATPAAAAAMDRTVSIPPGVYTTRAAWASGLLRADNLPRTACNLNAVVAWEVAEGGGFGNQASFNPLNVNPPASIGWPGHEATGAWAFPDAATGLKYTVATLNNGNFGGILAALRQGTSAQAVANAIMASPWAASHYGGTLAASC